MLWKAIEDYKDVAVNDVLAQLESEEIAFKAADSILMGRSTIKHPDGTISVVMDGCFGNPYIDDVKAALHAAAQAIRGSGSASSAETAHSGDTSQGTARHTRSDGS